MEQQEKVEKINNEQLFELLTGKEISWKSIIYDLINTEQLDPWDIDLALLSNKYLEKTKQLEETNFVVSSKVLLAASLLLRLKSEILLYKYIKSIDEILFGKKEETRTAEKIEFNTDNLPSLSPKTPLPRYRKVTLEELMTALDKAISTETRRIKREVVRVQQERDADIVLPKATRINIKNKIRNIYAKILTTFKRKQSRISYSELTGNKKEEKVACFLPCLHLDVQHKLVLEQENHLSEIYVWLYSHYKKQVAMGKIKEGIELEKEEIEENEKASIDNPLANFFDTNSEEIKGNLS